MIANGLCGHEVQLFKSFLTARPVSRKDRRKHKILNTFELKHKLKPSNRNKISEKLKENISRKYFPLQKSGKTFNWSSWSLKGKFSNKKVESSQRDWAKNHQDQNQFNAPLIRKPIQIHVLWFSYVKHFLNFYVFYILSNEIALEKALAIQMRDIFHSKTDMLRWNVEKGGNEKRSELQIFSSEFHVKHFIYSFYFSILKSFPLRDDISF